jgi:uncharacterized membrane protein
MDMDMNWLFYALLSPALLTVVQFLDKYIVERAVPDHRGLPIFTGLLSLIVGTLFWLFGGMPTLSAHDALLLMLSGALTIIGAVLYFRAVSLTSASEIIIILQISPVIVLILSFLFLSEALTAPQLIGFLLIFGAALGATFQPGTTRLRLSTAFWLVMGVNLLSAISFIIVKLTSHPATFVEIISYEGWGAALGGMLLYLLTPTIRHAFHHDLAAITRRTLGTLVMNETLFVIAKALGFFAAVLGSASLVSVLASSQIFLGIAFGWALMSFAPAVFREDIRRSSLIRKGLFAVVLFAGVVLLS